MEELDKKMRALAAQMANNPPKNFDDEEYEDDCVELNEPLWLYWQSKL